jgi:hypothetical protein
MLDTDYPPFSGDKQDFNVSFSALNGFWSEAIRLKKVNGEWVQALKVTRIVINNGKVSSKVVLQQVDKTFPKSSHGIVDWSDPH